MARRKFNQYRKLGRTASHKWAMLRNMVTSLIEHERIVTTTAKAKEARILAEKLVTHAKKPNKIHARRLINKVVRLDWVSTKLMNVLGPRYALREGGYTRIMKLAKPRKGDSADMCVLEYVDRPGEIRAARPPAILRGKSLQETLALLGLSEDVLDKEHSEPSNEKEITSKEV